VERERAIRELPEAHGVALRLRAAGREDAVIAEALGVPISALPSLVVVAEAKLAQLLSEPDPVRDFDDSASPANRVEAE
jgi:DNA-directed RNA polymerase specialized sigma24 family protein